MYRMREQGEGGGSWVGIDLHLLAESTASDEMADERGHTGPPVVPGKERISTEESPMSRGERRMNRRDKVMACVGRDIKTIFKIEIRIRKMPIIQRGTRKQRGTI